MTRKEKLAVINTVRCFVSLELREIDADKLLIREISSLMDTKYIGRITENTLKTVIKLVRLARKEAEKMPVTDRVLEAITEIQQWGMWFCGKFNMAYSLMD